MYKKLLIFLTLLFCSNYLLAETPKIITNLSANNSKISGVLKISGISESDLTTNCYFQNGDSLGLWIAAIGENYSQIGSISNCNYSNNELNCNIEIDNLQNDEYKIWIGPGIFSKNCPLPDGYVKDGYVDNQSTINSASIYEVASLEPVFSDITVNNNIIAGKIAINNISEHQLSTCFYQSDGSIGLWVAAIGLQNSKIGNISNCSYNNGKLICSFEIDNLNNDRYRIWIGPGIYSENNCLIPNGYISKEHVDVSINNADVYTVSNVESENTLSEINVNNNEITGKINFKNISETQLANCFYQSDGTIGLWVAAIGTQSSQIGHISNCSFSNGNLSCDFAIENLNNDTYKIWLGPGIFCENNCLLPTGYLKDGNFDANFNEASTYKVSNTASTGGGGAIITSTPIENPEEKEYTTQINIDEVISDDNIAANTENYIEINSEKLGKGVEFNLSTSEKPVLFKDNKIPENFKIVGGEILGGLKGDVDINNLEKSSDVEQKLKEVLPEVKDVTIKPLNGKIEVENVILQNVKIDSDNIENIDFGKGVIFDENTIKNITNSVNKDISIKQVVPDVKITTNNINVNMNVPSPSFPIMVDKSGNMVTPADIVTDTLKSAGIKDIKSDVTNTGAIQFDIKGVKFYTIIKDILLGDANNFTADNNAKLLRNGEFLIKQNGINIILSPAPYNINEIDSLFASIKDSLPSFSANIDEDGILTASWKDNSGTTIKIASCFSGMISQSENKPSQLTLSVSLKNRVAGITATYTDGSAEFWAPYFIGMKYIETWLDKYINNGSLQNWQFDRYTGILTLTTNDGKEIKVSPDLKFRALTIEEQEKLNKSSDNVTIENINNNWFLITPEGTQQFKIIE